MNWFFHRVYWTGWISHHNRKKKRLLALTGPGAERKIFLGLALLGFASVYREGFEVVLFLQNMRLGYGSATVLAGVAVGARAVAIVGAITFLNHHRLPYKRMLVVTGVDARCRARGDGRRAGAGDAAGRLDRRPRSIGIGFPHWLGTWFATFPNVEGLAAQASPVSSCSARTSSRASCRCADHSARRPVRPGMASSASSRRRPRSRLPESSSLGRSGDLIAAT